MVQHSTNTMSATAADKRGVVVSSLRGLRPLPLSLPGTASSSRRPSKRPRVVNDDGDDARVPRRRPVILYEDTPKVIHARPDEFKALVQRLTGRQTNGTASGSGDHQDQEVALSMQQEQDPLVLTLEQPQHVPPPLPLVDDDHHHTTPVLPPPSPGAADGGFLLSPSPFLFSPATMQAIHELIN